MMTAAPKRRLQALSQQLVQGIPSEGSFEDIPKIRHVAGDSASQRVKGKVVIVTGTGILVEAPCLAIKPNSSHRSEFTHRHW